MLQRNRNARRQSGRRGKKTEKQMGCWLRLASQKAMKSLTLTANQKREDKLYYAKHGSG